MLHNSKGLYGTKLAALDGDIGRIKDFYFDDKTWAIRYVIADTGSWLSGRLVLLSPHAFVRLHVENGTLPVTLRKKQIEDSPSIDLHKPVSRHFEIEYHRHYGWPAYWSDGAVCGLGGYPMAMPPAMEQIQADAKPAAADCHLQSTQAVTGYHIQTDEGIIGRVSGFLIDEKSWTIRDLTVEAGRWYSGKEVLIPTAKIDHISYEISTVFVTVTKADIQGTAEHAVVKVGAGEPESDRLSY